MLLVAMLGMTGCSEKFPEAVSPDNSSVAPETPTGSENSALPDGSPLETETPLAPAKEINRGGEEYSYDGWIEGAPAVDVSMLVDESWENKDEGSGWTDRHNKEAELIFKWWLSPGITMPPRDAIWKDYGAIIEKGGDVEYGEFASEYLAEAYYCKYIEGSSINIKLYLFFYPRDINLPNEPQTISALIYKNKMEMNNIKTTLNEDAFWKAAQSLYIAKGYEINNGIYKGYIPYIPTVDGKNITDDTYVTGIGLTGL